MEGGKDVCRVAAGGGEENVAARMLGGKGGDVVGAVADDDPGVGLRVVASDFGPGH